MFVYGCCNQNMILTSIHSNNTISYARYCRMYRLLWDLFQADEMGIWRSLRFVKSQEFVPFEVWMAPAEMDHAGATFITRTERWTELRCCFPPCLPWFSPVFPWFSARHHMSPSTGFPSWSTGKRPKPWTTTQTVPHLRGKISLISQLEQLGTAVYWPIVVQRFLEFLFCQSVNNRLQRVFVTYTWAILVKSLTVVNSMLVVKWIWGLVDKNKSSNIW